MMRGLTMEASSRFTLTPEKSSEAVIQFSDVHMGFAEGEILRGVSLAQPKETLVLLGETGSGKTLTLKLAAGLLRPDSGTVEVLGMRLPYVRARIAPAAPQGRFCVSGGGRC